MKSRALVFAPESSRKVPLLARISGRSVPPEPPWM
jgi:hypothetical protein